MVVSVTASTTSGSQLSEADLERVLGAADAALALDGDKARILQLVQLKMHQIAPNLSSALGTEISAKLMGVAGGLHALSRMPADNIQARPTFFGALGLAVVYPCTSVELCTHVCEHKLLAPEAARACRSRLLCLTGPGAGAGRQEETLGRPLQSLGAAARGGPCLSAAVPYWPACLG